MDGATVRGERGVRFGMRPRNAGDRTAATISPVAPRSGAARHGRGRPRWIGEP